MINVTGLDLEPLQIHIVAIEEKDVSPFLEWPENYPTGKNLSIRLSYLLDWTKQSKRMVITFFQKLTRKEHLVLVPTFHPIGSDPNKSEEIEPMIETFIQADGSDSLRTSEFVTKISKDQNDFSLWFGETRFMGLSMQIWKN